MGAIADAPRVLILRMTNVLTVDSTALGALRDLVRRSQKDGTLVLIVGLHAQPLITLGRSLLLDEIGDDNLLGTTAEAIARAREHLDITPAGAPS
jgi:SulP family sulfate permease